MLWLCVNPKLLSNFRLEKYFSTSSLKYIYFLVEGLYWLHGYEITNERGGWLPKLGRWVAKLVERLLAILQLSGFESRHLSKIQNGRHKQRSGQHTPARQKYTNEKRIVWALKTSVNWFEKTSSPSMIFTVIGAAMDSGFLSYRLSLNSHRHSPFCTDYVLGSYMFAILE